MNTGTCSDWTSEKRAAAAALIRAEIDAARARKDLQRVISLMEVTPADYARAIPDDRPSFNPDSLHEAGGEAVAAHIVGLILQAAAARKARTPPPRRKRRRSTKRPRIS